MALAIGISKGRSSYMFAALMTQAAEITVKAPLTCRVIHDAFSY